MTEEKSKEGMIWGIVAAVFTVVLLIATHVMINMNDFPGIMTVVLGFIPLLIASIVEFIYKVVVVASGAISVVALILNIIPKFRHKVGLILSIVSVIVCLTIIVLLLLGKIDPSIDVFGHVT